MEEIKITPEELKKAVDFGKLIGSGFFSNVFRYKGKLIKFDSILYKLLKANDPRISHDVINHYYMWRDQDFNDRTQLEELEKRQPFIRPKVPTGIITIKDSDSKANGISPAIIIPEFKGYQGLDKIPKTEYKQLLILLRKIFEDIKNLADNEIAQEDLFRPISEAGEESKHNIIQKGNDAQIIDMSGPLVKVGKEFINADRMYAEFATIINYYNRINGIEPIYQENEDMTEEKLSEMLTEFDLATKNRV